MADINVYKGSIPTSGFDGMQVLSTSSEGESSPQFGGPASAPKVVNEGGATQGKTYSKSASEGFVLDSTYKTDMEVAARPTSGKTVNPDDISHADSC